MLQPGCAAGATGQADGGRRFAGRVRKSAEDRETKDRRFTLPATAALAFAVLLPGIAGAQGVRRAPYTVGGARPAGGVGPADAHAVPAAARAGRQGRLHGRRGPPYSSPGPPPRWTRSTCAWRRATRAENNETAQTIGNYNDFWFDAGATTVETRRTSLVIDPPDGRVPPLTAEAADKQAALVRSREGVNRHEPTPGGFVDDLGPGRYAVRCLVGFNTGPPLVPGGYNQNMQVFQTEDTVVLFNEMIHDARIVPIDGPGRLDDGVRQWLGSSRAHWEGDTLVIETTNFRGETSFMNGLSDANLHLTEAPHAGPRRRRCCTR